MNLRARFLLIGVIVSVNLTKSQTIPTIRISDWYNAGTSGYKKKHIALLNIKNFGARGDGIHVDDTSIFLAVDSLKKLGGGIVYVPKGRYLIKRSIDLNDRIVLRGEGSASSSLLFDLGGSSHAIQARGSTSSTTTPLSSAASIGDTIIRATGHGLSTGDWLRVTVDDSSFISSTWSSGYMGQIIQVKFTSGDTLFLNNPLRLNLKLYQNPVLQKITPITNCGVEDMTILRRDKTSAQTSTILFDYTVHSWVYGVALDSANYSHITLQNSSNNLIQSCYLRHGHDYGNGGKAYGVTLQFTSGDNLVTNCIFERLRHGMLLQACANGNVISYNYSTDQFWTAVSGPSNIGGDLVLHGNFPFFNLFEGNIVQQIALDNSHGINGYYNTFYRNRADYRGFIMTSASDSQTIVANEITNTSTLYYLGLPIPLGQYIKSGTGHYEYGVVHRSNITPSGTSKLQTSSLYLKSAPGFWNITDPWPSIGDSAAYNTYSNPAEYRFQNSSVKTESLGYGSALPVKWLSVDGLRRDNGTHIFWKTTQEVNCQTYIVLRSANLLQWDSINIQNCKNTFDEINTYTFIDSSTTSKRNPLYYCVHQLDLDGSVAPSRIIQIPLKNSNLSKISFRPNPATKRLYIHSEDDTIEWLKILNMSGQSVYFQKITGLNQTVHLPDLKSGIYSIWFSNGQVSQLAIQPSEQK